MTWLLGDAAARAAAVSNPMPLLAPAYISDTASTCYAFQVQVTGDKYDSFIRTHCVVGRGLNCATSVIGLEGIEKIETASFPDDC